MNDDARDVHSFARPEQARVRHLNLDLTVSFTDRILSGTAEWSLERPSGGDDPLILDTRALSIEQVEGSGDGKNYTAAPWSLGAPDPILGTPLTIELPADAARVRIRYRCSPQASGLQWLEPRQTAGKQHPFLFSQNQSIHARSWIPIQDSPGVRITYAAHIHTPEELTALMSAMSAKTNEKMSASRGASQHGVHEFSMELPVPAYLIALAVGDLEFAAVGPRTGVWAEPSVLPKAAWEFADMEKMVAAVEGLYGPYRWGRHDLLILPPSFPFGGMENPRLTFATPTVIAGDRSLVGLVSHELAHSWSGNLVTNATWRDFWLNEGFTTYIENRIQEAVYGREQAVMEQALARRELDRELAEFAARDQILHIDLSGRDPDEGTTHVPYVKGALLVRYLEQVFGRERFDEFLKRYFDHFAFQSITTAAMLEYLQRELLDAAPDLAGRIPLREWIYEPGLPSQAPPAISEKLNRAAQAAHDYASGDLAAQKLETAGWSAQEWLEFLQVLPPMNAGQMAQLDEAFHLTGSGNCEILDQWLKMSVQAGYHAAYSRLESFLLEVGRQRFIKPLYLELMKTPDGKALAQQIYAKARERYHPIAQTAIDKIVGKAQTT